MSFNRLKYDDEQAEYQMDTSLKPGMYVSNPPKICGSCFETNPYIRLQRGGVSVFNKTNNYQIDTDTELKNINRHHGYDNEYQKGEFKESLKHMPDCYFPTDETRLSNPSSNLRGIGINRFDYPLFNPQNNIEFPSRSNLSSRLLAKDNFKPCLPNPAINDMTPTPKPFPCQKINGTCCSFTDPMYQYDVCG